MNAPTPRVARERPPRLSAARRSLLGVRMREAAHAAEPVAIVGMACRFPGASNPPELWELLRAGRSAVTEIPRSRWDVDGFYDPAPATPGKTNSRWGGFLGDISGFDAKFFGLTPREAASMDPQQRLVLEVCWEALDNGGQRPDSLEGTPTGVFIGICRNDYGQIHGLSEHPERMDAYFGTGNSPSFACGRVSYLLGLRGPSLAIDTTCSSSLVAVHLACQSLWSRESRLALAGGVNLILSPLVNVYLSQVRAFAPDGRCKAFDEAADGYVRAEGCGIVALKLLTDAVRDGDPIVALIRGSAVNHDGRSCGITAPSGPAQEDVLRRALAMGAVDPLHVDFVEAHGTGTHLGDPIEVGALASVYARPERRDPLLIGSIKSSLGHLEAAAGVAGLMKAALVLAHRTVPRQVNFERPSSRIDWADGRIEVAATEHRWEADGIARLAAVSSFGFSGTNAHVVLEEAPEDASTAARLHAGTSPAAVNATDTRGAVGEAPQGETISARADEGVSASAVRANVPRAPMSTPACAEPAWLLPLSARSAEALEAQRRQWDAYLAETSDEAADIGYTVACRRSHHAHRVAVVGSDRDAWRTALARAAGCVADSNLRVCWVFAGQGPQSREMGAELWREEPVFREAATAATRALATAGWTRVGGRPLFEELLTEAEQDASEIVQPALFALQWGLAALWRSWGLVPAAVVGHSLGEVAAACVAEILTLDDSARIVVERSRLLATRQGQGAMVAVALGAEEVERWLTSGLAIAAANSPTSCVVAGERAAVEAWVPTLDANGVRYHWLRTSGVAGHSPCVAGLEDELSARLADLRPRRGTVRYFSTVEGREIDGQALDACYWGRNLREPVRFADAIGHALASGVTAYLELSAHPVLALAIGECAGERRVVTVGSVKRDEPERVALLESAGRLWEAGAPLDWTALYGVRGRVVRLPDYPWQRRRFWIDPPAAEHAAASNGGRGSDSQARMAHAAGSEHQALRPGTLRGDSLFSDVLRPVARAEDRARWTGTGAFRVEAGSGPARARTDTSAAPGALWTDADLAAHPEVRRTVDAVLQRWSVEGVQAINRALLAPLVFLARDDASLAFVNLQGGDLLALFYAGPPDRFDATIGELQAFCDARRYALTVLTTEDTIADLARRGFTTTPFGVLQTLHDLAAFTLDGTSMRRLRYLVNRYARPGDCALREYGGKRDARHADLIALIHTWAAHRGKAGPVADRMAALVSESVAPYRIFLVERTGRLEAALVLSPAGRNNGYLLDLEFYAEDVPAGCLEWGTVALIDQLRAEGRSYLSLGGTFGTQLAAHDGADPQLAAELEQLHATGALNGDSNYQFKSKFRPVVTRLFLCRPRGTSTSVAALLGALSGVPRPPREGAEPRPGREEEHSFLGHRLDLTIEDAVFETRIGDGIHPFLADHRVGGTIIVPGAFYLRQAIEAGGRMLAGEAVELFDVAMQSPMFLEAGSERAVQTVLRRSGDHYTFSIASRGPRDWVVHAAGSLRKIDAASREIDLARLQRDVQDEVPIDELYAGLEGRGVTYGPAFRQLERVFSTGDHRLARVTTRAEWRGSGGLHPVVLDACFQSIGAEAKPHAPSSQTYLLRGIESLTVRGEAPERFWCHSVIQPAEDGQAAWFAHLTLVDDRGTVFAEARNICAKPAPKGIGSSTRTDADAWLHTLGWVELPAAAPASRSDHGGAWLVFADDPALTDALQHACRETGRRCIVFPTVLDGVTERMVEAAATGPLDAVLLAPGRPAEAADSETAKSAQTGPLYAVLPAPGRPAEAADPETAEPARAGRMTDGAPTGVVDAVPLAPRRSAGAAAAETAEPARGRRMTDGAPTGVVDAVPLAPRRSAGAAAAETAEPARAGRTTDGAPTGGVDAVLLAPGRPAVATAPDAAESGCALMYVAVHAVLWNAALAGTKLWAITRQGVGTAPGEDADPAHGAMWGYGRVLALEHPELWGGLVDVARDDDAASAAGQIAATIASGDENQVAIRNGRRFGARLRQARALRRDASGARGGTFLITGGMGGLGLVTAQWLARHGIASRIVLAGRTAPSADLRRMLDELPVPVTCVQADVSNEAQVRTLVGAAHRHGDLAGVIHSAGILRDGLIQRQPWAQFEAVFATKALGAWHLDRATAGLPLRRFITYSSVAAVLGSPAQSAHAAANAFLDALAWRRRAAGLPGLSINWGPWASVGAATGTKVGDRLEAHGVTAFDPAQADEIFAELFDASGPQAIALRVDWRRWRESFGASQPPLFQHVLAEAAFREPAPADEADVSLPDRVRREIAVVVGEPPSSIPLDVPIRNLGLDSIMTVELRDRLERGCRIRIPLAMFFREPSGNDIVRELNRIRGEAEETPLAELSDADVDEALQQVLAAPATRGIAS